MHTPPPGSLTNEQMNELIAKHQPEIDRVKAMGIEEQKAVFTSLGVEPAALEEHYRDLEVRAAALRERDASAAVKTRIAGWTSFFGGLTGITLATRNKGLSKLVRGFAIGLSGVAAGLGGTFVGSRVFAGGIREESRLLTIDARNAFERELAVALENHMNNTPPAVQNAVAANLPPAVAPAADAPAMPETPAMVVADQPKTADNIAPRDPSFAAQAAADKAKISININQRA